MKARGIRAGLVGQALCLSAWLLLAAHPSHAVTVPGPLGATIQAAIDAAPDGTTIDVLPGVYAEALRIQSSARRSLTIRAANGPGSVVVSAGGRGAPALVVTEAGNIRVEGLVFTGGTGTPNGGGLVVVGASPTFVDVSFVSNAANSGGGASLVNSAAVFERCVFRNNTAATFGGGLVIDVGSRPTFIQTAIQGNVSGTGAWFGSGGGVHVNDSSPTFRNSSIVANTARFAGGGIVHIGRYDSPNGTATLVLEDSEVSFNTAVRANPGNNPPEGGGIHIEDNALGRLLRVRVRNNVAGTGGGLSTHRANYEIRGSVIEDNQALDPLGVGGFGGGLDATNNNVAGVLRQPSVVSIDDSVVRNNQAHVGGAMLIVGDNFCGGLTICSPLAAMKAALIMTNSLVDGNTATQRGGGVYADRAAVTIAGSHIIRNAVTGPPGLGGGLMVTSATAATVSGSTIAGNAVPHLGGGVFVDLAASVAIDAARIYENQAAGGGGIFVGSDGPPSGEVRNSVIADNTGLQIVEQGVCADSTLVYVNNSIVAPSGPAVYQSCQALSVSGLNTLPAPSGNTADPPSFVSFLATPDATPTVLSWVAGRASRVTVSGVGTFPTRISTADVTSGCPATFTLTSPGGAAPQPVSCGAFSEPSFQLAVNGPAFRTGDTMILTGALTPGSPPMAVDVYIVVRAPDGSLWSLQGAAAVLGAAPIAVGVVPVPFAGEILRHTFRGAEPAGAYTWMGALTVSGTGSLLGGVDQDPFSFSP